MRRVDFGVTALFGAVYAAGLFLVVSGFADEPGGCGGRFRAACAGETYWRLGLGFGLHVVVAPVLHKLVPSVPFEQGVGRAAAVAALVLGAAVGLVLVWGLLRVAF
ncbi:hypothetical protein [Kitasatospora cheerisanensis]|uniref:Uncharacterized protein n=1 Tax=Kitasatospora cheerisanensis KCTC 2395 TaxID=1348663 RepID=A0A066YT75_9ACTN|nr:hypothetical protein [Kitasatospora cheerisanensis]KDN81286.1 hypothetical protein KCH_69180 [Kitasatospora cheerisanensis KCTC 2395]